MEQLKLVSDDADYLKSIRFDNKSDQKNYYAS